MDGHNHIIEDSVPIPSRDFFPRCIVWSPIPVLTFLLPFVGHLGIVTSEGEINDFAGPYYINVLSNNLLQLML